MPYLHKRERPALISRLSSTYIQDNAQCRWSRGAIIVRLSSRSLSLFLRALHSAVIRDYRRSRRVSYSPRTFARTRERGEKDAIIIARESEISGVYREKRFQWGLFAWVERIWKLMFDAGDKNITIFVNNSRESVARIATFMDVYGVFKVARWWISMGLRNFSDFHIF